MALKKLDDRDFWSRTKFICFGLLLLSVLGIIKIIGCGRERISNKFEEMERITLFFFNLDQGNIGFLGVGVRFWDYTMFIFSSRTFLYYTCFVWLGLFSDVMFYRNER
jgi:hypothetical protein